MHKKGRDCGDYLFAVWRLISWSCTVYELLLSLFTFRILARRALTAVLAFLCGHGLIQDLGDLLSSRQVSLDTSHCTVDEFLLLACFYLPDISFEEHNLYTHTKK